MNINLNFKTSIINIFTRIMNIRSHIIRDHIKLLAEAKIYSESAKKHVAEVEEKLRKCEHDVCVRDKAIAELRLRLPASNDRDALIESSFSNRPIDSMTPTKAAQSTIEALQVKKSTFLTSPNENNKLK